MLVCIKEDCEFYDKSVGRNCLRNQSIFSCEDSKGFIEIPTKDNTDFDPFSLERTELGPA